MVASTKANTVKAKAPIKKPTRGKAAGKPAPAKPDVSAKTRPDSPGKTAPAAGKDKVLVRMYCQGLGDCFLLRFPIPGGYFKILIDCGVILGTPGADGRIKAVIDDIADVTGGKIDLLVGTHEHWDHLSGLVTKDRYFQQKITDIGQVWLGWTENLADPQAKRLSGDRTAKKNSLARAAASLHMRLGAESDVVQETLSILGFFGIDPTDRTTMPGTGLGAGAAGADKTGEAMNWLRENKNTVYCEPGEVKKLPGVAGVRVYVLGPPRDEKQLMRDLPGAKEEGTVIYKLGDHLGVERLIDPNDPAREDRLPFEAKYRMPYENGRQDPFFEQRYFHADDGWRRIDGDWAGDLPRMALKLDSATNNTSLALAFELPNGDVLLFPGDAQVGNWESWHEDGAGTKRVFFADGKHVTAEDLLNRTVLYKVGHHGSHNATLKERGLEYMTHDGLVAMIPCEVFTAHEKKHWTKMPFVPMTDALKAKKAKILQADDKDTKVANVTTGPVGMHATELDADGKEIPVTRPLYFEYPVEYKEKAK